MQRWLIPVLLTVTMVSVCFGGCVENQNNNGDINSSVFIEGKGGYSSIQAAIDDAENGDTVLVKPGTYYETIVVNKSIKLVGGGAEKTTITCRNDTSSGTIIIKIVANNTLVEGFRILSPTNQLSLRISGIMVVSSGNTITNNTITNCAYGVYMYRGAENTNISFNMITNNQYGIYLLPGADNNIIWGNNVSHNEDYGMRIKGKNNEVFENMISHNNVGMYMCCGSAYNNIYNNSFIGNNENAKDDKLTNSWSKNGWGNYWDDYKGVDEDEDGVGDTPYLLGGRGNRRDDSPLMEPPEIETPG
ncbi:MAG TPA: hypothetical protein ENI42_02525 [Thermoplasmatales archaeon]|nr:hypothetical protein [Thermoplasmatales archaeon]